LAVFYIQHPAYLTLRAEAIAADAPEAGLSMMIANVGRVAWGLVGQGDPNPLLNLPGRPLFDPMQALCLLGGVYICVRRGLFSARALLSPLSVERADDDALNGLFLLFWAALMLLPSIVSGVAPTFGRSIGAVLPLVVIAALGLDGLWRQVARRWPARRPWAALAVALVLVASGGLVARDYFVRWARLPGLEVKFHGDMARIGRYIGQLPGDAVCYMTPTQKYFATLLLAMGDRERPRDFYGPTGLLPAGDPAREAAYLILAGDDVTGERLEARFPGGSWDVEGDLFASYRVPPAPARGYPARSLVANFDDRIRLLGYEVGPGALPDPVEAGATLSLTLTWRALDEIDDRQTAFVHLVGDEAVPANPATGSRLWAQDDHEPGQATYATDRWFSGEIVIDRFTLRIPPETPSGSYSLTTGFYDSMTRVRLPRTDGVAGGDDTALLGMIRVAGRVR
jgi:hypothetical protein